MPSSLEALSNYAGGADLHDPDLVVVSLLLFGPDMKRPSLEDARRWSEHFGIDEHPNHHVLIGHPKLFGKQTRSMVPGFQLIDRDFVLRQDAAGNSSPQDLWRDLMPTLGRELR